MSTKLGAIHISFKALVVNALTGPDGFCGQARNTYCLVRPLESTENYNCNSEITEDFFYGNSMIACGTMAKSGGIFKGLIRGKRTREAETQVTKAIGVLPNIMNGVKVIIPVGLVMGADEVGNAWLTPEITVQQHEALMLIALAVMSSPKVEQALDNLGNSWIALGFFKAYLTPLIIFLGLISATLYMLARGLAAPFIQSLNLAKSLIKEQRDETLDITVSVKDLLVSFVKPSQYVIAYVIANFAYTVAVYDINTYSFTANMLITDDITIANIIMFIANEVIRVAMNIFLIKITFGNLEMIVKAQESMLIDDELTAQATHDESANHVGTAKDGLKDATKKKQ